MKTMRSITIVLLVSCLAVGTFAQDATIVSNTVPLVEEAPVRLPPAEPEPVLTAPEDTKSLSRSNAVSRDLGIGATRSVRPGIRLLDDGAVADYGLFTVRFPAELTEAPITILTPNGRKLACRATFLALFDAASGQSLLLGEVQKTIGELDGDSTVLYPNAFDTVAASIRFRYTPYSLEQDILLLEQIQLPKEFQPENVQLEVWSAWIDSTPDAVEQQIIDLRPKAATSQAAGRPANDDVVTLGGMRIADGYAFGIQGEGAKTPVAKTFARIEGHDWLIERVDYTALKPMLDLLPKPQASLSPDKLQTDREKLVRSLHARSRSTPSGQPNRTIRMAQARTPAKASVVVDFIIVSSVPAPTGLLAWWTGGGNPLDSVGNANATMLNGAGYGSGKVGQAFNLDGSNDRINATNSAALNFGAGADFSIEAWIKPLTNNTTYGVTSIVDKRNAPNASQGLGYEISLVNGKVACRLSDSLANVGTGYGPAGPDLRMDGNFHHVAMTVDRDSTTGGKLYVDGAVVLTFDPTVEPGNLSNTEPVRIGNHATASLNCYFKGIIDEPSIYNRALSASEVLGIYNAGAAGKNNPKCITPPADIAGWWPGDGNAYDLARTNFGTLVGNTTYVPAVAGQGFSFDGSGDGVTISNNASLNVGVGESFSIEAWIQPLTNSTTYGVTSIVDKRVAPNTSQCLGYVFCLVNGVMNLRISDSISGNGANFADTQDLRIGSGYHHIAVTVNRGSTNGGHFYVDGVQRPVVFNPRVVSGSLSNAGPFLIGLHAQTGFNGGHKGVIDEVSFYRRELTNTEIAALYSAGSAGKCKVDTDGDGLTDLQEAFLGTNPNLADTDVDGLTDGDEVFVYRTNPGAADTDGDGLSDLKELTILVDASIPGCYLSPLNPDTGNTGTPDGDKDSDHDLLSNVAEIRHYGSNPSKAHTFNETATDAEYKTTGRPDGASSVYLDGPHFPTANQIQFFLTGAAEEAAYDLYLTPNFDPGWKWKRYYSGSPGQKEFTCPIPPGSMNYFRTGLAADSDGDGLTDGYECLVSLTGLNTFRTDGDTLPDGWEVEYLLDPTKPVTPDSPSSPHPDGNYGNPDNDTVVNKDEFTGASDPKRINPQQRPVVSISVSDRNAAEGGDAATFRITRPNTTGDLFVYYVLGGSAAVSSDYTLTPLPSEAYPGYSIKIPAGSDHVDLQITPLDDGVVEGTETVIIGLMPNASDQYVVATSPHRTMASIRDLVCHEYELNADFLSGLLVGVNASSDRLYLNSSQPQQDYLNVACSGRGTVARIHVTTGAIIGEYRTSPAGREHDPSRTTVDQFGNVWVANRAELGSVGDVDKGSITRIGLVYGATSGAWKKNPDGSFTRDDEHGNYLKGPFDYNTCLDRDGDGYIRTSRGKTSAGIGDILPWSNQRNGGTDVDTFGGVSTAEDEAIQEFVRVQDIGTRTIAVDKFNDVWVGGTGSGNGIHEKVDGLLASVVPNSTFTAGCGGYGGFINKDGALWSAQGTGTSLLRFVPPASFPPTPSDWQCLGSQGGNYGLAIDPETGQVWYTWVQSGRITRWESDGTSPVTFNDHGYECAQGVVVDANKNVWVAHAIQGACDSATHIGHIRTTDGKFIGNVNLVFGPDQGVGPTGLSVDSKGYIWVTCQDSDNAWRIDPTAGEPIDGVKLGAVDRAPVDLGEGAAPYNYSDMTGFHNQIANPGGCSLKGYWTVIENGGSSDRLWSVSWNANTPTGTRVEVYARASDNRLALSNEQFVQVANDVVVSGVRGQFLEVRTLLARGACGQNPYLENLTICSLSKTLTLIAPPTDQSAQEGQDTAFEVVAIGTEPLSYQWFLNGSPVGANSSVLSLSAIDCLDRGQYTVHITDASGDEVDAGPAFLNVYPPIVMIPLFVGVASVYPMQITVAGAPTSISSVEVVINGFNHDRPDDVDILLVPPFPAPAIMLMSDAGGTIAVQNLTLTFSQSGFLLPDEGQLSTGAFAPQNFGEPGEQEASFPAGNPNPPAGPYATDLSLLNGIIPNGIWRLYVVDDTNQRSGFISGSWCLILNP